MDVAEDLYVANDLYEEDDFETGINRGASPTRDGAPSPPRMQAMEVDSEFQGNITRAALGPGAQHALGG